MSKLKFIKPIEVTINGYKFEGKEIEFKDMRTAAEVVRIAKMAYGNNILE